jgi:glycerophosphoryl diester phosphodiesterase
MVSSFAKSALAAALDEVPGWPHGLLVDVLPENWAELALRYGCSSIHTRASELDGDRVAALKGVGLDVLAYTVNDPDQARGLWGWGVDSIFSDWPEQMHLPSGLE